MGDSVVKGNLGSEAKYDISFEDGQLVLSVRYDGDGIDGHLEIMLDAAHFVDMLADAIPGTVDDAVFAIIKAAVLK